MALKITAEEVLKRIEQKFGLGVLAFDESSYKGTQKQASFACQVNLAHGSWKALTNNVLKGQGCPQCGRERVLAAVIARSGVTGLELQSEVSQLGYLADLDKERTYYGKETIFVSCSSHGPFTTRPCYIRQGKGCPHCALEKMRARAQNKSAKARDFFEAEIIQKHGPGIIDFTRTSYSSSKIKVEVGCLRDPSHGFWLVSPSNLKKGRGCPKCGVARRPNTRIKGNAAKFKESVIKRHGLGAIDLSQVSYASGNAVIVVNCLRNPAHGRWDTTPTYLLSGRGCPKCAREKRADFQNQRRLKAASTLQSKVNEIFGSMAIDTSVGFYISALESMKVRCLSDETHGSWMVRPGNLLSGFGCPSCGTKRAAKKLARAAKNKFVSRVTEAHGVGVIEVDETKYRNANSKVQARCLIEPLHGTWEAHPMRLVLGHGCPKCENDKKRERGKQWAREAALIFPDKVTQIHGDNVIGLDLVEYVTARIPVKFMCLRKPEHGVWETSPDSVLGGSGCPKCSASRGEREITKFLSDQGIIFEHQKILFEVYRYDFYLPELNVLIEYDGEQHFFPISFGSKKSKAATAFFHNVRLSDKIKTKWATDNGYELHRIAFTDDCNERLAEILLGEAPRLRTGITSNFDCDDILIIREMIEGGEDVWEVAGLSPAAEWQIANFVWRG